MIDLDDEAAFMASLGGTLAKQEAAGIKVGQANDEPEPVHKGIQIVRRPFVEPIPEPVPYEKRQLTKILATVDLETDPFLAGRRPEPFSAGFAIEADQGGLFLYGPVQPGGAFYYEFWDLDCVNQFFDFLADIKERALAYGLALCVYAHNGGRFDFNYFMPWIDLDTEPMIIGTQKVKISFAGVEFRDSAKIMPLPLAKLKSKDHAKLDIDYGKMEALFREQHRDEILVYLKEDCLTLLDAVRSYIDRFGWQITIASTALPLLESMHGVGHLDKETDELIRPYYKGGRVQCFETGIIKGRFIMVDANSMYPSAMKNKEHPVSSLARRFKNLDDPRVDFALIDATSQGCLGTGDGLAFDFTPRRGKFFATMHEIRAGLETNTLQIHRVLAAWGFQHRTTFGEFVDTYYNLRNEAKASGDEMGDIFYKLILNSSYGKLAMRTDHHKTFRIGGECPLPKFAVKTEWQEYDDPATGMRKRIMARAPDGWRPQLLMGETMIWSRPKMGAGGRFINCATAASITGAARADLWRAICASVRPLYCDTDSVICEAFNGDIGKQLGQWKVEAEGDAVLIAGKKMYAFLSLAKPKEESEPVQVEGITYYVVKKAHKGVTLSADEIRKICNGETIATFNFAPTFDLAGNTSFITRLIKMTGNKPQQYELEFAPD